MNDLIITHIFWDTFTSHGDKPSCIEETAYNLCFGDPLCRRLQKLVGNDKLPERVEREQASSRELFSHSERAHCSLPLQAVSQNASPPVPPLVSQRTKRKYRN